jgi:hypothetical protein
MPDRKPLIPDDADDAGDSGERRRLTALRTLVDELLGRIREVSTHQEWSPEERAKAEEDLDRIMASVRDEALRDR